MPRNRRPRYKKPTTKTTRKQAPPEPTIGELVAAQSTDKRKCPDFGGKPTDVSEPINIIGSDNPPPGIVKPNSFLDNIRKFAVEIVVLITIIAILLSAPFVDSSENTDSVVLGNKVMVCGSIVVMTVPEKCVFSGQNDPLFEKTQILSCGKVVVGLFDDSCMFLDDPEMSDAVQPTPTPTVNPPPKKKSSQEVVKLEPVEVITEPVEVVEVPAVQEVIELESVEPEKGWVKKTIEWVKGKRDEYSENYHKNLEKHNQGKAKPTSEDNSQSLTTGK